MVAPRTVVSDVIDAAKIRNFHVTIIGLCAFIVFLDGFDAQAIGYVAPALIKDWGMQRHELGPVFSIGLIGLMLGALFVAPLADRFGRRPVIIVSTALFGLFSLATAWAGSVNDLLLLRFLTGVGLGGCMPNAIALTSEFSPQRSRALLVMLMFSGFTLGSIFGGLVSAEMIPAFGWKAVFIVGGVLPLAVLPLLWFALPESVRFLVLKGDAGRKIAGLLKRIDPGLDAAPDTVFVLGEGVAEKTSVTQLFRNGRGLRTVLLWVIFFMSLLDVYMLVNWLPTAMSAAGASMKTAIQIGVILQVGGIIGAAPLGWLLDRAGVRVALAPAYLLATACIACIGVFATVSIPLTMLVVFGAGFGVIGGQTAANAIAASAYPTEIRSTGVGWALGIGRVGSIVGPALAGVLIGMDVPIKSIFLLSAIPAAIAVIAALLFSATPRHEAAESGAA